MKKIYLLLFSILIFGKLHAQTWDGSASDDWNNMNNWTPAAVPTGTSNVIIPGGLMMGIPYPKLATDVTINTIYLQPGCSLDVNGKVLNIVTNVNNYTYFLGGTINNTMAGTDIVINLNNGGGGYHTYFRSTTVNDDLIFNITGTNQFYEGDAGLINEYKENVTFNFNSTNPLTLSNTVKSHFYKNLTINRTIAAGTTNIFGAGITIDGNFTFTNTQGGSIDMGNISVISAVTGSVNIAVNYSTGANAFKLYNMANNNVAGSNIQVDNSLGFNIQKNNLKLANFNVNYTGQQYGTLYDNTLVANIAFAANSGHISGYHTYIRNNTITGTTSFSNSGSNILYEADAAASANHFIGNTTFAGNSAAQLIICQGASSTFDGNLTINRTTAAGTTNAFGATATINGNFQYTNLQGGATNFGNETNITNISGTINIAATYLSPDAFEMVSLKNLTNGGSITVLDSRGYQLRKSNLLVNSISITGFRGSAYGYLFDNTILGNVTIADHSTAGSGYNHYIRNNIITGLTNITNNGSNKLYEADAANTANHFIGNVTITGNSASELAISNGDNSIFDGNLTINRTGAAGITNAFAGAPTINGNFQYSNLLGGASNFGNETNLTNISGTLNITATYISPDAFKLVSIKNVTAGGSITVQDSRGYELRKSDLKVNNISITGFRGNDYGLLYNNTIVGNVTISDFGTGGGYYHYVRSNTITGLTNFTNNGGNTFYEADAANSANHYIGNVVITGNSLATLNISGGDDSIFDGNLTINRTGVAGSTDAFNAKATINGNFTFNNILGGNNVFGSSSLPTNITGIINMVATYPSIPGPGNFEMSFIVNQTLGGNITVIDSKGFDLKNNNLKVGTLSVTGYRGNDYGYLYDNTILGNVTIADHSSYAGGYSTTIRSNTITGNTSFIINGSNQFHDAVGAAYANKYIGNVSYTKVGGTMNVATSTAVNEISGNLTLNSTSGINTGLFKFNGATNSTIEQLGTQAIVIEQLTVAKISPGKVILADPVTLSNSLTLTTGNIVSTAANLLTLNDNVTATGGSSASFVEGPLAKKGNDIFTFPIGKGTKYGSISITAPASAATSLFTAEYKDNNPTADGYDVAQKEATLNHILPNEYWLIDGNSTVFVTMAWEAGRSGESINPASARVAHWANNIWEDEGNSASTGPPNNGSVKTGTAISNFSPFAIASIDAFAPLPLTLISFTGKNTENGNQLNWQTADEKAFSHFEIERSENAKKFEKIGEVKGSKGEIYEFIDNQISTQASLFYRLKMVDLDGTSKYSKIINIENDKNENVTIYPNPTVDYFSVNNVDFEQIQLMDLSGKILKTYSKNSENKYIVNGLAKGIYFVKITSGNLLINRKIMVE